MNCLTLPTKVTTNRSDKDCHYDNKKIKMKYLRLFKLRREELLPSACMLVAAICLHAIVIARHYDLFTKTRVGHWNVFINNFTVSGFDPITYSMVTYWEPNYNVYRHPLLSFMVWPLSMLDKWLTGLTGMNLVQFIVAVPLLLAAFYTFIFMLRIFRDIIRLPRFESTVLTAMLFSFAYVMLAAVVPDHFCISMFLLVFTLYAAGIKIQAGTQFKIWQTILLFTVTAGVTLSNGIKTFIYSLATNGRSFFRLKYFLLAVLLPAALIWGFARWEYRTFVLPKELARNEAKAKRSALRTKRMYERFKDTTSLKGSDEIRRAFNAEVQRSANEKKKQDSRKAWNRHTGKPMGEGEFIRWTDISTSRAATAVENLFGESIQLHPDHLLEDTLRSRPVIIRYRWAVNYVVEALLVALFAAGIWCGRRSRFLWAALGGFAFDMALHLGLGFGINEVYIMGAHWLFVMPLATGFAVKAAEGSRLATGLRWLLTGLTAWLLIYNFVLFAGYMLG